MKGRKRHVGVDVLELTLDCYVTAANVADIKAAPAIWVGLLEQYGRIAKILAALRAAGGSPSIGN